MRYEIHEKYEVTSHFGTKELGFVKRKKTVKRVLRNDGVLHHVDERSFGAKSMQNKQYKSLGAAKRKIEDLEHFGREVYLVEVKEIESQAFWGADLM